ncbi:uncharacterized protein V1518DRAFT_409316 [Limtongia smithiae]|uniref:uncharacterized protein n=1 Tax=Limtongia smithiae TaxID=1125753 RepID=UPI0034CD46D2
MPFVKNAKLQNAFANHPIFVDVVGTHDQRVGMSRRDRDLNIRDMKDLGSRELIAVRGSEVFVATGGEVRCADCANIRNSLNSLRYYKTLSIPDINFTIRKLQINDTGTYLAIVGDHEIVVCALPFASFSRRAEARLHVRHKFLGETVLDENDFILKTLWHPLSKKDSCLMVLSSDNVLRMFDVSFSYEEPDLSFDFSSVSSEGDFSYGISASSSLEPVSMCFGIAGHGLGQMALYVLMKDGDIYILNPFIPRQSAIDRDLIQLMLEWAAAEDKEASSPSVSKLERFIRRRQFSWVADISVQSKDVTKSSTGITARTNRYGELIDLCAFERPSVDSQGVKLQGPVLLQPFPKVLYKAGNTTDITSLEVDDMTIFFVSYESGRVNLYLEDTPVTALWENPLYEAYVEATDGDSGHELPRMFLLESISLKSPQITDGEHWSYWFIQGALDDTFVLIGTETRIVEINVKAMTSALIDAFTSGKETSIKRFLDKPIKSNIITLSDAKSSRILGQILLRDTISGTSLVTLSEDHVDVLLDEGEASVLEDSLAAVVTSAERVASPRRDGLQNLTTYQTLMTPMDINLNALAMGSGIQNKLGRQKLSAKFSFTEPLMVSEETLNFFGEVVELLSADIESVYKAGYKIHRRTIEQRAELRRQLLKLAEIQDRICKAGHTEMTTNVAKAVDRQRLLADRASALQTRLIASQSLPLSDAERKWIQELQRVRGKLQDSRGLTSRTKTDMEQSRKLMKMLTELAEKSPQEPPATHEIALPGVRSDKIDALKDMIESESKIISRTRQSLDKLLEQVNEVLTSMRIDD